VSDQPTAPKRRKSRQKMRRITVPGDDVPRTAAVEEDVDLEDEEGDDASDDEHDVAFGDEEDDGDDFDDDEPTDPNVFRDTAANPNVAPPLRNSILPPEGGSLQHDGVVVSRSRIISDHPAALVPPKPSNLPPPPGFGDGPHDDEDDPVLEQYPADADGEDPEDGDDEEDSRPTLHAPMPASGPVRTKTPPPPPGPSIMIAEDYVQEVDELILRRQAEETLPASMRPSAKPVVPIAARPAKVSERPPASTVPREVKPRVSAPPSVPTEPRGAGRPKPEASLKPSPPAPPRKILTPVPPPGNKPPPPPKEPGVKRPPPWWKTFFSDDYLRSVIAQTPAQVKRQCDFVEAVLGLPRGATILDIGCGTGLQAIELTERGYLVVGLDLSLPMITRAAEEAQYRNLRINFLHTDIREIQFDGAFDAVVCLGTTFGFFDDDSNRNVLGRLRDALKPGGRLLLDLVNRDHVIRSQPNLVWFQGDGCVCMEESDFNYFTSRLQVKRTMMHEDGRQSDAEYSIRLYSLHEIGQLLNPLGFRVIEVSGQPATRGVFFGGDSTRIIALAERRGVKPDAEKVERGSPKQSLKPAPVPRVEEEGEPAEVLSASIVPSGFDDDEATDPNIRVPPPDDD